MPNCKFCGEPVTSGIVCRAECAEGMRWISVEDRLPDDFEWVLAVDKDRCVGEAMFSSRDGSWDGPYGEYHLYGVTHWMPMPEPPEEETGHAE